MIRKISETYLRLFARSFDIDAQNDRSAQEREDHFSSCVWQSFALSFREVLVFLPPLYMCFIVVLFNDLSVHCTDSSFLLLFDVWAFSLLNRSGGVFGCGSNEYHQLGLAPQLQAAPNPPPNTIQNSNSFLEPIIVRVYCIQFILYFVFVFIWMSDLLPVLTIYYTEHLLSE